MVYKVSKEEVQAIKKVILSYKFDRYIDVYDSVTNQFEKNFSKTMKTSYCLAVSSGTAALICGLIGMEIGPGDEVIIPAYTYIATALAVLAVGATPVIAEIDSSLTIDPEDISQKITNNTKVIIPVHMRGLPCNMEAITKISEKNNLLVLEDVAQACGGSYRNVRLGAVGDAGIFSFNHYKNITCGEGGALITKNSSIYQRALLQHHGGYIYEQQAQGLSSSFPGGNFRLSEISSAMLIVQLKRLDSILSSLRKEKRIILNRMVDISKSFNSSPIHDVMGDCGSNVFFTLESKEQANKLLERASQKGVDIRSAFTKGHVYCDWKPVLEKRRVFEANNKYSTSYRDICQKTIAILERTVGISTRFKRSARELNETLKKLATVVKEVE